MKRILAACLVVLLLLFMVTASASTAGSSTSPLITLSYLDGVFASSLRTDIQKTLESSTGNTGEKLEKLYINSVNYSFAPRFIRVSFATGDTIMLTMGSSFILLSGSATLSAKKGTVINISTGQEAADGSRLTLYNRYFCAEDSSATITANSSAVGQVDGLYYVDTAIPNRPHPVFRDVMENDWYYPAVSFVYGKKLFEGTTPNTFSPATPMTRGMFVTVLYRLAGEPATGSGGQFIDVQNTSLYYYKAVTWANTNKIVEGYSNGTFRPNDLISREQMATIMYRYASYMHRDMSTSSSPYNTFPDTGDVSGYAVDPMRWAVSWGVISGSNGKLLPRNTATRAQVAQIVFNYVEKVR